MSDALRRHAVAGFHDVGAAVLGSVPTDNR